MIDASHNLIRQDCQNSCANPEVFSVLKNQTILVTGGTGFMGKWLTEMVAYINETQHYNIRLYLLGRDLQRFKEEVPHLAAKTFVRLIEQDVKNVHDLPQDINYIFHAAGSPDNREHVSQPLRTVETFYKGTQAVLDAASHLPDLKKFIHISSHQVYGTNELGTEMSETFAGKVDLAGINSIYAESKRVSETLCAIYRNQFKLPIVILRPFAFVGPYHNLEKPWAVNNFIRDGILGGPIRIIGNGLTLRSYLYASDMAYWMLKTLVNGQIGEKYNLGSKHSISLNDLAAKIKLLLNSDSDIEILSKSSKENYTNFSIMVPDTTRIMRHLGVKEMVTIDEALTKTIFWNQLNRT
ncbi:MAG TPA: NAD-dependent epimerase/dehydratase family protein [Mucilaginibacter sp.]